ncbi:MAG: efflux RND transporter periplasmic adaptor subunit [Bacteroidota bacterium]
MFSNRSIFSFLSITGGLLILLVLQACSSSEATSTVVQEVPSKVAVNLAPVIPANKSLPIRTSGVVASKEEVKLAFKIGGVIQQLTGKEGTYIRKGQLLARLNPAEINAQVKQAELGLNKANRDLQRVEKLFADTVATLEQVQDLTTAKEVAAANLDIARFNQQYAVIYAPVSGRILRKLAEEGEVIGPGTPVYMLASAEGTQVIRIQLVDKDVVKIKLGDEAQIALDAYPNRTFKGVITEIAAGADPRSGTFEVEVAIDSEEAVLKNGFVGSVTLKPKSSEGWVKVPMDALVEATPYHASVFVLDNEQKAQLMELQNVVIGDSFLWVQDSQLAPDRWIVTDGARLLNPGDWVQVSDSHPSSLSHR